MAVLQEVDQQEDWGQGHEIHEINGQQERQRQPGNNGNKDGANGMRQSQEPGVADQLPRGAVEPGMEQTVEFEITEDTLKFVGADLTYKAEKGKFRIFIGASSESGRVKRSTRRALGNASGIGR